LRLRAQLHQRCWFCSVGMIVVSIGKIAVGQHAYYEQQVAQGADDYYSGRGEVPGEWRGAGARALGLSDRVGGRPHSLPSVALLLCPVITRAPTYPSGSTAARPVPACAAANERACFVPCRIPLVPSQAIGASDALRRIGDIGATRCRELRSSRGPRATSSVSTTDCRTSTRSSKATGCPKA
jgi:hypothetical protein